MLSVAPARERGLKLKTTFTARLIISRSREGAWIEIKQGNHQGDSQHGRSREGAWIEILYINAGVFPLKKSLPRGSVD